MGLLSFVREAGEKLFGRKDVEAAAADTSAADKLADLNQKAAASIVAYIAKQGWTPAAGVSFDGASSTVTVAGTVADQATKEKVLLCCGNVDGVDKVDDQLRHQPRAAGAVPYRGAGDTLSAIANLLWQRQRLHEDLRGQQADARPPDKIYPGQVLRIPV
jgi:nucleoid-associated protein YgaU